MAACQVRLQPAASGQLLGSCLHACTTQHISALKGAAKRCLAGRPGLRLSMGMSASSNQAVKTAGLGHTQRAPGALHPQMSEAASELKGSQFLPAGGHPRAPLTLAAPAAPATSGLGPVRLHSQLQVASSPARQLASTTRLCSTCSVRAVQGSLSSQYGPVSGTCTGLVSARRAQVSTQHTVRQSCSTFVVQSMHFSLQDLHQSCEGSRSSGVKTAHTPSELLQKEMSGWCGLT